MPLSVEGILDYSNVNDEWKILRQESKKLILTRQRFSSDPLYHFSFDLESGVLSSQGITSSILGSNGLMGESASVIGGVLTWRRGGESVEFAREGQDGVSQISYPRVFGEKVLFVNHWYRGEEKYAVFLAGRDGVVPVITPETVLPDGGLPASFPRDIRYTGNTYAIDTTSTMALQQGLWLISFDGGPLMLSPARGGTVPGTDLVIKNQPEIIWLNDSSAGFLVTIEGTGGEIARIVMQADGEVTATVVNAPVWGERIILPGSGFVLRNNRSIISGSDHYYISHGPAECYDMLSNIMTALVVTDENGRRHLMLREGSYVQGFGVVSHVNTHALVEGRWLYVVAKNVDGKVALLKAYIPVLYKKIKLGKFLTLEDETVRFMIHNLTHGEKYCVERAASPAGPWLPTAYFTGGSPSRSVLGNYEYGSMEFYRVSTVPLTATQK